MLIIHTTSGLKKLRQFNLLGSGDTEFATIILDDARGMMFVDITKERPHSDFSVYASIRVKDAQGKVVFDHKIKGTGAKLLHKKIPFTIGYQLEIYHAEPENRLISSNVNLIQTQPENDGQHPETTPQLLNVNEEVQKAINNLIRHPYRWTAKNGSDKEIFFYYFDTAEESSYSSYLQKYHPDIYKIQKKMDSDGNSDNEGLREVGHILTFAANKKLIEETKKRFDRLNAQGVGAQFHETKDKNQANLHFRSGNAQQMGQLNLTGFSEMPLKENLQDVVIVLDTEAENFANTVSHEIYHTLGLPHFDNHLNNVAPTFMHESANSWLLSSPLVDIEALKIKLNATVKLAKTDSQQIDSKNLWQLAMEQETIPKKQQAANEDILGNVTLSNNGFFTFNNGTRIDLLRQNIVSFSVTSESISPTQENVTTQSFTDTMEKAMTRYFANRGV